jgi:hypothetical protein
MGIDYSLQRADDLLSHGEPGYSPAVAADLKQAYARIKRGHPQVTCAGTTDTLHAWLDRPMSARQRLRALYVLAMEHAADQTYRSALEYLEDGLDLAGQLADRGAIAELAYLHAAISTALAHCGTAHLSYGLCLDALRTARAGDAPADPELELAALAGLAITEYMQAQHGAALRHLDEATALLPLAPTCRREVGELAWVQAQLFRLRGEPARGLHHALAAAEVLSEVGPSYYTGMAHAAVAEHALDLAEAFPSHVTGARDAFAALARCNLLEAGTAARALDDPYLAGYVALIETRLGRVLEHQDNRVAAIERVVGLARRTGEVSLACRAHTALGEELWVRGETEGARVCYRRALEAVAGSDVPVIGAQAQRALLRISELQVE